MIAGGGGGGWRGGAGGSPPVDFAFFGAVAGGGGGGSGYAAPDVRDPLRLTGVGAGDGTVRITYRTKEAGP